MSADEAPSVDPEELRGRIDSLIADADVAAEGRNAAEDAKHGLRDEDVAGGDYERPS